MRYAQQFLEDPDAAKNLLTETGYSTNQALSVVTRLGELCVLALVIEQAFSDHERGALLSHRFEVELNVTPLRLHRTQEVNLIESLEDCNVLIRVNDGHYRSMLSSTLNRLFSLTAESEPDSIRSGFTGIMNPGLLESALNELEWEIVNTIHDLIDLKYLQIDELETTMVPDDLVTAFSVSRELAGAITTKGGVIDGPFDRITSSFTDSGENLTLDDLKRYMQSIVKLSEALESEVIRQRDLIRSFNIYPRSFVGRGTPPLAGSSWNHRADFKDHPLIKKFLELIKDNHTHLAYLADKYEDYIAEVAEGVKKLPRGIDASSLFGDSEGIQRVDKVRADWSNIDKKLVALSVQAKLVEGLVSSMDTLFEQQT